MQQGEPDPFGDPSAASLSAARLGVAVRNGFWIVNALDGPPSGHETPTYYLEAISVLQHALRDLLEAVETVAPFKRKAGTEASTESDRPFALDAGVPSTVFTEEGQCEAEDWLLWSAIYRTGVTLGLDELAEQPVDAIVPGIQEVICALPQEYDALERFTVLRSPRDELDGLSPIRWLLLGRPAAAVVAAVESLGWHP